MIAQSDTTSPATSRSSAFQHASMDPRTLIDQYIEKQSELTPIERFAERHDRGDVPAQAKYYQDLIPVTTPKDGQQYAFDVDLDSCSGCKACVTACHSMNGLDEDETWRDVGVLVGGTTSLPVIQHVTTTCHHCLEPACQEGCPVMAYDKDPVTGIVKHLDDQCIGCQYCIFKCPYDVPKYNKRLGIVRKCDMCSDRLAEGEAPACAAACPTQAIRIRIVDTDAVIEDCEANTFLPGAPDPDYTLPTTNYQASRVMPRNMLPGDYHGSRPQHPHMPLVAMLVLTQLSVGAFIVERIVSGLSGAGLASTLRTAHAWVALVLGLLALGASTLHLGRPLYAFRAVIGLRTSWLSREIIAFGGFALAASIYAGAVGWFNDSIMLLDRLNDAVIALGVVGVFCSVMLYHDTRRAYWQFGHTTIKFVLTMTILGTSTTLLTLMVNAAVSQTGTVEQVMQAWGYPLCLSLAATSATKLVFEALVLRHLRDRRYTPQRRSAELLVGPLARVTLVRFAIGLIGGIVIPLLLAADSNNEVSHGIMRFAMYAGILVFLLTLIGELFERYLFFAAVVAPKMPGGVSA